VSCTGLPVREKPRRFHLILPIPVLPLLAAWTTGMTGRLGYVLDTKATAQPAAAATGDRRPEGAFARRAAVLGGAGSKPRAVWNPAPARWLGQSWRFVGSPRFSQESGSAFEIQ
jgi:hypothetical protein